VIRQPLSPSALFEPWIGKKCSEIVRHEHSWQFSFAPAGSVTVESLWRIIVNDGVVLCSLDDGQRFGLPKPVDAAQAAWEIIFGKIVRAVLVSGTGDLTIQFETGAVLEILINSSGYESWNAASWSDTTKRNIIATGGGELTIFEQ